MRAARWAAGALAVVALAGCGQDPPAPERAAGTSTSTPAGTPAPPPSSSAAPSPEPAPAAPPPRTPEEQQALDTALIAAAWADDVPRARDLIAAGADVNAQDGTRQSAYLIATSEGHRELLELTLAAGADLAALDRFNGTGLIRAAERGHADVVGRLLQAGIAVDHVNRPGFTALHEAVIYGDGGQRYVDTVRLLVARGTDVALAPVRDGIPPLQHARSRGQDAVAATLQAALEAGPPADPAGQLLEAAAAGDADRVALALRAGAGLETRDAQGRTPLLLAAANDRVDVARLLVALGADPDALDGRHDTPWLVTGVTGSVAMLEVLLPAGPDLTIRNRFGGVSVIPAAERGHVDYVRRVVQTGIDVNHVNDPGWTALLEAVVYGDGSPRYQEIVRILLAAGADPLIRDADGRTALDHALARGHAGIVQALRGG
ncbi:MULTISPECIES: ankyrin repeat domain-containing protein [unclassified Blastococcus]